MPQYLAPGVYVEEIPGPRSIEGVGTSTAGFIGPCRFGPTSGRPELLTSNADFLRIYGDSVDIVFEDQGQVPNYMAVGVKGFFDEGGSELYVCRTFNYTHGGDPKVDHAWAPLPATFPPVAGYNLRARFPGVAGRMQVTLTAKVGRNALVQPGPNANLTRVHEYDLVLASNGSPLSGALYVVRRDHATGNWQLKTSTTTVTLDQVTLVYPLTVLVDVRLPSVDPQGLPALGPPTSLGEFGFDPRAVGTGITTVLTANPPTRRQAVTVPVALEPAHPSAVANLPSDDSAAEIADALFGLTAIQQAVNSLAQPSSGPGPNPVVVTLQHGTDGNAPTSINYDGDEPAFSDLQDDPVQLSLHGLHAFEAVDDISIVVAPGASSGWNNPDPATIGHEISASIINHCERMRYRVAAIDTPPSLLPADTLDYRNNRSSNYAALYYPWITIANPNDGSALKVPPAPFMAGIWARSDNARGVIKAPANEVVRSAVDLETRISKAQQELLNPDGVNCLRFFPGPGFLVWGARTISDDPEWKYLSMRRYFNYLEKSIDVGTQWVVFEINGPALWDSVRHTVEGFLLGEWKSGALLGAKPEQAYFVRCDLSTMTQADLDNGRLICAIGVAAAKPAEFVIFRISQYTATTTS
jgi:phage tail sheath protein FI